MKSFTDIKRNTTVNMMMSCCGIMCTMMCMCMDTVYLRMRFSSDIRRV